MNIDDLLHSTRPVLYETGNDDYPYFLSGTCYPVKFHGDLFIVSAFHCYENRLSPENTLYPRPDDPKGFFAFGLKVRARVDQSKDDEHYDQVVLQVCKTHHPECETSKVAALDLAAAANSRLPTSKDIVDFIMRGYPFDCPKYGIDYDRTTISYQAYTTNRALSVKESSYDYCYLIRMKTPIPSGMSPNGISGAPVYGITKDNTPVYCGTIIKHNYITGEYLMIGAEVLVNTLKSM